MLKPVSMLVVVYRRALIDLTSAQLFYHQNCDIFNI